MLVKLLGLNFPRRFSRRLIIVLVLLFVIFVVIRSFGSSLDDDEEWYKHPFVHFKEVSCESDDFTARLLDDLTDRMNSMLSKLGITYFLCYGSLWGALKFQKTLPWDRNNIDFCVIYHQIATIDEQTLHQAFKQAGLNYYYNSRRGKYVVTYKTVSGEITVFEKIGSHCERVGWEKRLFPHLYLNFQNFPYQLVERDLLKAIFNGIEVPVPHQEYELQKYLYPENWWKEVKPRGCV
jgi:hypothetical protein